MQQNLRPDIQGLRAFAVVAVILDHLLGWPSGGFVGVDIFFVLSGFLITGLLLREHERSGRISFSGFYRRRVKRIMPAAVLVLLLTVAASFLFFNEARAKGTLVDSIWALFFGANWRQAIIGTDYFAAGGPESPVQHYWSLAVEEQFYLMWPWLMVALFAIATRVLKSVDKPRLIAGVAMLVMTAASFAWSVFETSTAPTTSYFSTFSRAWELGVGALLACASTLLPRLPAAVRPYLAWTGLAGMCVSLFIINAETAFPGPSAALPVLSTALVIAAGTGTVEFRGLAPLTNRVTGYIGDISYSLYLWHFPVIVIGVSLFGHGPLQLAIIAAVFTAGAIYAYHLVEDPIRKSGWLSGRPSEAKRHREVKDSYKLTALSLLAVLTACSVAASLVPTEVPQSAVAPTVAIAGQAASPSAAASANPQLTALHQEMQLALTATSWPALSPTIDEVIAGPQATEDIIRCGQGGAEESGCTWGDPAATRTIVTVGNSISMNYVTALRAALRTTGGWKVVSYGMFGCPFGDRASTLTLKTIPDGCSERADEAVSAINRLKPDIVILAGTHPSAIEQLSEVDASPKFVFIQGAPIDKNIESCYTRISKPSDCVGEVRQGWGSDERRRANSLPNGVYLDTVPWFCLEGKCPSFVGKVPMKKDNVHMSSAYAEKIAPVIWETLQRQGIL